WTTPIRIGRDLRSNLSRYGLHPGRWSTPYQITLAFLGAVQLPATFTWWPIRVYIAIVTFMYIPIFSDHDGICRSHCCASTFLFGGFAPGDTTVILWSATKILVLVEILIRVVDLGVGIAHFLLTLLIRGVCVMGAPLRNSGIHRFSGVVLVNPVRAVHLCGLLESFSCFLGGAIRPRGVPTK